MTAPGSIVIAAPGWWSRTARVGTNSSNYGWASSTGSILSAEAFGLATVAPEPITIHPTGIPSGEAMGTDHFLYPQSIGGVGIASAEAFGTPRLVSALLAPTGIASAEAFGTAKVNLKLAPTGIASTEAFGTAKVNLKLLPTGIASAEAFGTAAVKHPPAYVGATTSTSSDAATSPVSLTDTIPASTNLAIVWVNDYNTSATGAGVTVKIGTTSMVLTKAYNFGVPVSGNYSWLYCFTLFSPPTGSQTVKVTSTNSTYLGRTGGVYYSNITSLGTPTTATESTASMSASATSTNTTYLYAQAFAYTSSPSGATLTSYNQTRRSPSGDATSSTNASPLVYGDAFGNGGTLSFTASRSDTTYNGGSMILPLIP